MAHTNPKCESYFWGKNKNHNNNNKTPNPPPNKNTTNQNKNNNKNKRKGKWKAYVSQWQVRKSTDVISSLCISSTVAGGEAKGDENIDFYHSLS